ncbi:MAG: hypothetical protein ACTSYF_12430, partial [Promethearchaeota archaeon]
KGSFMIRGERNYYKNVRLELVVGIQLVEQPITLDKLKKGIDFDHINELTKNVEQIPEEILKIAPVVIGGPPGVVEDLSIYHIQIKPTRDGLTSGKIASKLKNIFLKEINKNLSNIEFPIQIEEIQRWIPSGRSKMDKMDV